MIPKSLINWGAGHILPLKFLLDLSRMKHILINLNYLIVSPLNKPIGNEVIEVNFTSSCRG